jgi:hypothetical protein
VTTTVLSCRTAEAQDKPPAAEKRVAATQKHEKEKEKEGFTAWGKEVGGLQAGLGFRLGEKRAYHHGEAVGVVLRVRNVGKEAVEFKHIYTFFLENPPTITDADGKKVELLKLAADGRQMPRSTNVAPGKEVELYNWSFDLRPQGESGNKGSLTIHGTGKFSLQCERIVGPSSSNPNHPNPTMDKLATGKLELKVEDAEKLPMKKEKEDFTAWGKEFGGLQAGLALRPGEKRVYRQGEVITLVVRVRNVSKETVKFKYIRQFLDENPPTVTDADGKTVPQHRTSVLGFHAPVEVSLEPGKEIELESRLAGGAKLAGASSLRYEIRPPIDKGMPTTEGQPLYLGTGKVSLQMERVFGNSSSGRMELDPIRSKLATGNLELEVKSKPPAGTEKK